MTPDAGLKPLRRSLRGSGARRRCNAIKAGPPEGGRYNTARCCTGWSAVVFCSPGRADVWRPWGFSFSCFRVCNEGKFPRAPAGKTRAGRPGLQPHHPSHVVIPRPASGTPGRETPRQQKVVPDRSFCWPRNLLFRSSRLPSRPGGSLSASNRVKLEARA